MVLGLALAALWVLGYAVTALVHRRPDIREARKVLAEEHQEVRAGTVRPGWARVAAIADALILAAVVPAVAQSVLSPRPLTEQLSTSSNTAGQVAVLVLAVLAFGFITFAHRQATVPSPAASGKGPEPTG
ncbi:hypothetical protein ACFC6U_03090 [Kitasatospora purpeofusca]|uniref:hypothetical protein n=1 Tax=Kitasatospora purpeofusca TaxID=67352 RepID=UPI0035DB1990